MKVELIQIYDRGVNEKERLHFRVTTAVDLGYYIVYDTSRTPDRNIQNGQKTCYWFPQFAANVGDNIIVYTRGGINNTERKPDGVFHFRFRGLSQAIYADANRTAVVFELATWNTMP